MSEDWKDLFAFNQAERRGIWLLSIILSISAGICLLLMHYHTAPDQVKIERLFAAAETRMVSNPLYKPNSPFPSGHGEFKDSLFYFDPNVISANQWEKLGLSPRQAEVITRYTGKGGRFNTPEDLKKSFVINERFFTKVKPWIRIQSCSQKAVSFQKTQPAFKTIDLNLTDTTELKTLKGIGSILANRIINYRKSLGGFHAIRQLSEVYGLSSETIEANANRLSVSPEYIVKLSVSVLSTQQLSTHPYVSRKLAYAINELRNQQPIRSSNDLQERLPPGIVVPENLWPYLQY
jgi:competence protein ComEA